MKALILSAEKYNNDRSAEVDHRINELEAIEKAMYENPELAREFRHARVLEKTDKARELFKSLLLRAGIPY